MYTMQKLNCYCIFNVPNMYIWSKKIFYIILFMYCVYNILTSNMNIDYNMKVIHKNVNTCVYFM